MLSQAVYNMLVWAAQPWVRRKWARRAVAEPGYATAVPERFGHYQSVAQSQRECIWVHAVSLGETRAAGVLIQALREALPEVRLLLTHGTATGRAEGAKLLRPGDLQVWQPWDTPQAVQRFLRHFQPRLGLLMETEVWPNLVMQSARLGVPVALVNARMSEKSLRSALRWSSLMRPTYAALAGVWAQTEADAQRLRALSATVQSVTGNLKFDAQPDAAQCAQGRVWRAQCARSVVVLASSREGEESMWLDAVRAQPHALQAVQWLIVPRHPQRVDEVHALLVGAGLSVSRRSQWPESGPSATDVWLGDSLGEMALYYSLADAALLGGSFAPLGGQNLIEAAACACPVFMGPHTFNFKEVAAQAVREGAACQVADMAQAVLQGVSQAVSEVQMHPDAPDTVLSQPMGWRAMAFAQAHKGAARRVAGQVIEMLAWPYKPGF